ncbi:MAG: hypothetical protein V9G19_02400 [Tetrasphaera sp.]
MSDTEAVAVVFPGMGPVERGEYLRFLLLTPAGREVLAEAEDALEHRLDAAWLADDVAYSPAAQLGFLAATLALAESIETELDEPPVALAGPSFGCRAVAIRSGSVAVGAGFRMAARMAAVMDDYFTTRHPSLVTQSFGRLRPDVVAEIMAGLESRERPADLSCRVDEDFVMITLDAADLEEVVATARKHGAMPLFTMKPPMHARYFAGLRQRLDAEVFADIDFRDPAVPVVGDQDGQLLTSGSGIRNLLLRGCDEMVDWPRALDGLAERGVTQLAVAGEDGLFTRVPGTTKRFRVRQWGVRAQLRPRRRLPLVA